MDVLDSEEQEGAVAGVLSPSQLVAVKTLVRMLARQKGHARAIAEARQ